MNTFITHLKVKKILREIARERKRCAKQYPDWRDDEFNNLDDKFIWGCPPEGKPSDTPTSFNTWDDAYIYFNRADGLYYMEIDTGFYNGVWNEDFAQDEIDRLHHIKHCLEKYMYKNQIPRTGKLFPFKNPELCGNSVTELYLKLCVMIEGYTRMMEYRVVKNDKEIEK